jgi:peptide/nickel transport system permease protein
MSRYIIKRILLTIPTFLGITLVTFAVIHLAPGNPVDQRLGDAPDSAISPRVYEQLEKHLGLDQPTYVQYGRWLKRIVTLDFGRSFADGRPVWHKIRERLPWTLSLAILSMIISLLASIPTGVYSAAKRNGWFDTIVGTILYALYSVPSYVTAIVLITLVVSVPIDWLPIRGAYSDNFEQLTSVGKLADVSKHILLILVCYTYPALAFQSRFVRGNVLEAIGSDYVRTARAKGLSRRAVLWKHAFPNSLIPLVTMMGLLLPTVVSGSVILEVLFQWPGIGRLFYSSILARDYPTVMALSVITAAVVLFGTLLADLTYALVDPRVRYDE